MPRIGSKPPSLPKTNPTKPGSKPKTPAKPTPAKPGKSEGWKPKKPVE